MPSLRHTIKMLKIPLLEDGVISLGETTLILRALRPFILRNDATACELRDLVMRVRQDGVVTGEESARICRLLDKITDGGVRLEQYINEVHDFPVPGAVYRDTSRLYDTPWLFKLVLQMADEALADTAFDIVISPEPQGVAFGAAIAARRGCGFVPVRAAGTPLPREAIVDGYDTEEGRVELQMHADAIMRGERVVLVDNVLATGRQEATSARLVTALGGRVVKMLFALELAGYGAREGVLQGIDIASLVKYPGL